MRVGVRGRIDERACAHGEMKMGAGCVGVRRGRDDPSALRLSVVRSSIVCLSSVDKYKCFMLIAASCSQCVTMCWIDVFDGVVLSLRRRPTNEFATCDVG